MELIPPIPRDGTLLTAHHLESFSNSFNLRLQGGVVLFEYNPTGGSTSQLTLSSVLDDDTTYRIELETTFNSVEITLSSLPEGGGTPVLVERLGPRTIQGLYPQGTVYDTVCVGGSVLEHPTYRGTLQSVFYGYNSLLEERNLCSLEARGVPRSTFVNFVDDGVERGIRLSDNFTLRSHRVSFQVRYPRDMGGHVLVADVGPQHFLAITTINTGQLFLVFQLPGDFILMPNDDTNLWDDEWHSYVVTASFDASPPTLSVLFDGSITTNLSHARLADVADIPIQIAPTHSFGGFNFAGCMRDIELQDRASGEVLRLNLEALPRTAAQFNLESCFECVSKARTCGVFGEGGRKGGEVCVDRGFGVESVCECRPGFTGDDCAGTYVCACVCV